MKETQSRQLYYLSMEYILDWILYFSGMCGNAMWHLLRSQVNVDFAAIAVSECWNGAVRTTPLSASLVYPFLSGEHIK